MALSAVETKVCKTCQRELSLDNFGRAPNYKDKIYYRASCKECCSRRRGRRPGFVRRSVVDGMKPCTACGIVKPVDEFYMMASGYPAGNCKDCTNIKASDRYATDATFRQRKIDYAHSYFESNREAMLQACRNYRKNNRHKCNEWSADYRARKNNAFVEHVDYFEVVKRDNGICYLCNEPVTPDTVSFDHVRPLSKGGEHSMANVRLVHLVCNLQKGARWEGGDA